MTLPQPGSFAIDVGWFMKLNTLTFGEMAKVYRFFESFGSAGSVLLLDTQGAVLREYEMNIAPNSVGKQILTHLFKEQLVEFRSPTPTLRCQNTLNSIRFDPADQPYIGLAQSGRGVFLAHEEKHLVQATVDAIFMDCAVRVCSLADILS